MQGDPFHVFSDYYASCRLHENDYFNGLAMQALEQRLIRNPSLADFNSKTHILLCLLYLHLYRQKLFPTLLRPEFKTRWESITASEKEKTAARFRRKVSRLREEYERNARGSDPR